MLCFDFIMSLKVQNSLIIIAMLSSDGTAMGTWLTRSIIMRQIKTLLEGRIQCKILTVVHTHQLHQTRVTTLQSSITYYFCVWHWRERERGAVKSRTEPQLSGWLPGYMDVSGNNQNNSSQSMRQYKSVWHTILYPLSHKEHWNVLFRWSSSLIVELCLMF